jgi:hypothetical protein
MDEDAEKQTWLQSVSGVPKAIVNVLRATGPFLVAQSDKTSEAYARHKMRLAGVSAAKELLHEEIKTLTGIRRELLEKYFRSHDSVERLSLKRDLEELAGQLRQANIGQKALTYVETTEATGTDVSKTVSSHWMDKFNELARSSNEPWREELLARALAQEANAPGTIVPRALWLLGTLEQSIFEAFSALLDLSVFVRVQLMIPSYEPFIRRPIPNHKNNASIGNLLFQLTEVGLISDITASSLTLTKGGPYDIRYHDLRAQVECPEANYDAKGIIYTTIGQSLASFSEIKENPMGREIYDVFLKLLESSQCKVRRVN